MMAMYVARHHVKLEKSLSKLVAKYNSVSVALSATRIVPPPVPCLCPECALIALYSLETEQLSQEYNVL